MTGSRELAVAAARAASSKQAVDVVILDVSKLIVITDFFVIGAASNDRQLKAIADEIETACRDLGAKPVRREGEREAKWILLDYVDFVAHVFTVEERDYYGLERLWGDAPVVEWDEAAASNG